MESAMTLWTIPTGKSNITGQAVVTENVPGQGRIRRRSQDGMEKEEKIYWNLFFLFSFYSPTLRIIILTVLPAVLLAVLVSILKLYS